MKPIRDAKHFLISFCSLLCCVSLYILLLLCFRSIEYFCLRCLCFSRWVECFSRLFFTFNLLAVCACVFVFVGADMLLCCWLLLFLFFSFHLLLYKTVRGAHIKWIINFLLYFSFSLCFFSRLFCRFKENERQHNIDGCFQISSSIFFFSSCNIGKFFFSHFFVISSF